MFLAYLLIRYTKWDERMIKLSVRYDQVVDCYEERNLMKIFLASTQNIDRVIENSRQIVHSYCSKRQFQERQTANIWKSKQRYYPRVNPSRYPGSLPLYPSLQSSVGFSLHLYIHTPLHPAAARDYIYTHPHLPVDFNYNGIETAKK